MKNRFKQHKPGWADDIRENFDFATQDELLGSEVLKRWKKWPDFHRFSISTDNCPYTGTQHTLMAELEEGRKWWVVGYIDHIEGIDLPEWVPVR